MAITASLRESRDELVRRARDVMRLAKAGTVPNRALIHIEAAETWLTVAVRKPRRLTDQ